MPRQAKIKTTRDSIANFGFEADIWLAADKLRNNMDAAEPKRSGASQSQVTRRGMQPRQTPKPSNATTRRLAIMNLAIRGLEADIGKKHADCVLSTAKRDSAFLNAKLTAERAAGRISRCLSTAATLPCAAAHFFKAKPSRRS